MRAVASIFSAVIIVALALLGIAGSIWLFYGGDRLLWWRADYIRLALTSVIVIGFAVTFRRARRGATVASAVFETGISVFGCAAVVAVAVIIAASSWPLLLK